MDGMGSVAVVVVAFVLMLVVERLRPGRRFPRVPCFLARAAMLNLLQIGCVLAVGRTLDPWLREHRLWSADRLGVAGGALLGYVAVTFLYYWWHRARHAVPFLWRWFHQLHHSPRRIELVTSFYKHPVELIANALLSSAILYLVVGVGAQPAAIAVTMTGVAELFYHWNVATPYWLGFLIQRPESHCVHHQEGVHAFNFGDLPLWDWLFGTLRNPREWDARCGFGEKENELGAMLRGVDVSATRNETWGASTGAPP